MQRLHHALGPESLLPRVNDHLVLLANHAESDDGLVGILADPHQPGACLAMGSPVALDERLAKRPRGQWTAVLDEAGDAQNTATKARVFRQVTVLVEPVVGP